jgi:hypothetical protein
MESLEVEGLRIWLRPLRAGALRAEAIGAYALKRIVEEN